jgi:hypothetical protein
MLIKIVKPFTNITYHASWLDFDFFGRGFGGSFVTATQKAYGKGQNKK